MRKGDAVPWHQGLDANIRQTVVEYAEHSVRFYTGNLPINDSTSAHSSPPEVLVSLDIERRAFDYCNTHHHQSLSSSTSTSSPNFSPSPSPGSRPDIGPSSGPSPDPFVRDAVLADDVAEGFLAARRFAALTQACDHASSHYSTGNDRGDTGGRDDKNGRISGGSDVDVGVAGGTLIFEQTLSQCLDPALRHITMNAIYGLQIEGPTGWTDMLVLLLTLLRTTTLTTWINPPLLDEQLERKVHGAWLLLEERRALTLDYLAAPLFALGKNVRLFMANYTLDQVLGYPV